MLLALARSGLAAADGSPGTLLAATDAAVAAHPSFNRDIRPILSENCFACHGQDANKRRSGLALHDRTMATTRLSSGATAIIPGDCAGTEEVRRITSASDDERMPPTTSGKHLTQSQIQTLERWIRDGATYQVHWAYMPPAPVPPTPAASATPDPAGTQTPIDAYILARLRCEGLQPSAQADRITLIRRLSFDLGGLPPSTAEVDAFLHDSRPDAYDQLVDRLLASPHFGERMAVWWLDLVRYADSVGYHSDNPRNVSPYRDWVIAAFNADMPFDQFTREQLAGDLLPAATLQSRVASCYNRLLMTTEEGGAQPKEYECKSSADRVRNVSSVWLGSTMQCCECHDHKFDPFSQRDFYSMAAFFADIQEAATGAREPGEPVPSAEQQARLQELERAVTVQQASLDGPHPELADSQGIWEASLRQYHSPVFGTWFHLGPFLAASAKEAFDTAYLPAAAVDVHAVRADHRVWDVQSDWQDGVIHHFVGDNSATYCYRTITCDQPQRIHLSLGSDDTITVWLNESEVLKHEVYRGVAPDQERLDLDLSAGTNRLLIKICNGGGDYAYYFKATTALPADIVTLLALPSSQRTPAQAAAVSAYYRSIAPALAAARQSIAELHAQHDALLATVRRCLVTTSGPARRITVKAHGNWMDESGAECQPAVPHFLRQINLSRRPSRLDLADWLVSADNPLVARVLVNRLWQLCFGMGLAKTVGDLGTQGSPPSHPELLDFLAQDLVQHGWDIKRTLRMLVRSSTYRQSSQAGSTLARDPDNHLLARQGRFRIAAEFVRDAGLAISGLLVDRQGGGSVMPYQPAGYWMYLNFPPRVWTDATGDDEYRRGIYTVWQRTFLHPSLLAFDAPSREECCADRSQSNTPQQALVLLNDPTYLEAARVLAELALSGTAAADGDRAAWMFRRALARAPLDQESAILLTLLADQRALYQGHPAEARQLLGDGLHQPPATLDRAELAAWTMVARAILNMGETYTRN